MCSGGGVDSLSPFTPLSAAAASECCVTAAFSSGGRFRLFLRSSPEESLSSLNHGMIVLATDKARMTRDLDKETQQRRAHNNAAQHEKRLRILQRPETEPKDNQTNVPATRCITKYINRVRTFSDRIVTAFQDTDRSSSTVAGATHGASTMSRQSLVGGRCVDFQSAFAKRRASDQSPLSSAVLLEFETLSSAVNSVRIG